MSARRLAAEQSDEFAFSGESEREAEFWLDKFPDGRKQSAVIPLLWLAQQQEGWISRAAIESIAERLGMPNIRVMEVATFYTMFNLAPVGEHHIQVCGTTPCMLRGANELKAVCERRIGRRGATSADGKFTWSEVECLGACVNAPMAQISSGGAHHYFEDLTPETLEALMDALADGGTVRPGSQSGRQTSAPEGGPQTLLDESLYDGSRAAPLEHIPNAPGSEPSGEPETKRPKETSRNGQKQARTDTQQTPNPITKKDVSNGAPATIEAEAESLGEKPETFAAPRAGGPDDLKEISGVGPKIEAQLHKLGIYHFDQIASWSEAEIDWVDSYLRFKGRIGREDWIAQARKLAKED